MKIEVRNLKHFAAGSQETHCFTATIYVDGKAMFHAENNGHGGCDMYRPIPPFTYADEKRVEDFLASTKPVEVHARSDGSTFEIKHSLEIEVGDQINKILGEKALRSKLNRRIMAIGTDESGKPALFEWPTKFKPVPANIARLKETLAAKGSTDIVLNGLPVTDAAYQRALELV